MTRSVCKKELLGSCISATTYEEVIDVILDAATQPRSLAVTALDVHGLYRAARDAHFRRIVNSFDIVTPDGQSLKWGLNMIHSAGLKDRVAGPDLTLRLCARAAETGCPVFFYGSKDHVVRKLVENLRKSYPKLDVVGFRPSRFRPATCEEDQGDVDTILNSGARLTFVGLGCPLQEKWVFDHLEKLNMPLLAVGAAFDFLSGNKSRAPRWIQQAGMEWAYRALTGGKRVFWRNVRCVPLSTLLVAQEVWREVMRTNKNGTKNRRANRVEIPGQRASIVAQGLTEASSRHASERGRQGS